MSLLTKFMVLLLVAGHWLACRGARRGARAAVGARGWTRCACQMARGTLPEDTEVSEGTRCAGSTICTFTRPRSTGRSSRSPDRYGDITPENKLEMQVATAALLGSCLWAYIIGSAVPSSRRSTDRSSTSS